MKLLRLALMFVFWTLTQAISFSTIGSVSVALISLNKPVNGFFGIFRRRKSPVQETEVVPPEQFYPGQQGMFNPFGGGNMFLPGFSAPAFGMFGQNRFPPQFRPPQQMKQSPQRPPTQPSFPPQQPPMHGFPPQQPPMHGYPPQQPPMHRFPPQQHPTQQAQHFPSEEDFDMDNFREPRGDDQSPGMNTEEAESFFTLLSETDESKCISRLVCEMGANPESGGEFGQTISEIIGSLNDFPDGSKVSEYNEVLNLGLAEGLSACVSKFSACDEESYQLVKKAQVDDDGS